MITFVSRIAARVSRKVRGFVRLSHAASHWFKVWGLGLAWSAGNALVVTNDWQEAARLIECKIYLGPLLITLSFPAHIPIDYHEPTYCKPNKQK
jgi:hypothetical protein